MHSQSVALVLEDENKLLSAHALSRRSRGRWEYFKHCALGTSYNNHEIIQRPRLRLFINMQPQSFIFIFASFWKDL